MIINRPHVVLPEVAHVADDTDPNQHGAGTQEDAAHIVAGEHLEEKDDDDELEDQTAADVLGTFIR